MFFSEQFFFWDGAYQWCFFDRDGKKKIHLVNWDTLSTPSEDGGLGFFKTFQRNQAFLGKLVWRMNTSPRSPWAMVCNHRLKSNAKNSIISKCLKRGTSVVNLGIRHVIHSGLQTSLWHDTWLPKTSLRKCIEGPLLSHEYEMKVANALDNAGNWIWEKFSFILHDSVTRIMLTFPETLPQPIRTLFLGALRSKATSPSKRPTTC